jgi:hypothetical protein
VAQPFRLIVDEHISKALVKALRDRGFAVVRVVDELEQGAEDPEILEYAAAHGHVWLCRDERARGHVNARLAAGKPMPGVAVWAQRYRRVMSVGDVVRKLEALAAEQAPFAAGVRYIKPDAAD